jgi:Ca-activated chloride channel homolog
MRKKIILILMLVLCGISVSSLLLEAQEIEEKATVEIKPAVVFVTPQANKMWFSHQPVTIRLTHINPDDVRMVEVYLDGRLIKELQNTPFTFTYNFGNRGNNRTLKVLIRGKAFKVVASTQIKSFEADDTQSVVVKQVVLPVVVKKKNGNYVRGLKLEDFEVLSDDKPVNISYLKAGGTTRFNMAQVVDVSYSMKEKVHDVFSAAGDFMKNLMTANDRGVFIFFNHYIFDHAGLTSNMEELMDSRNLKSPVIGDTALYDAIAYTLDLLKNSQGWNIIVLFSDGEDNSSYINRESLLYKVKQSAVVIYAIDNGGSAAAKVLNKVCDLSGGMTFPLDNVQKTNKVYEDIREDIKSSYLLYFTPPHNSSRKFHQLSVKVKGKNYQIRTLKGYY